MSITTLMILALQAGVAGQMIFSDLKRVSDQPLMVPRGTGFESAGAFNPAVIRHKNKFVMIYRAQDGTGKSYLGYAESRDGVHFEREDKPVMVPEAEYEKDGGVEDPRLIKFGATYYLTYTGYNKTDAQLCIATSKDLKHWQRQGIAMPANKGTWNVRWTKSGAIVPVKIAGKYWMYYMGDGANDGHDQMGLAVSDDLLHWTDATKKPVLERRPGEFDSQVVEPGPPPIITADGILLVYNGADDKKVYRTAWVLFDKKDPGKVLARSNKPIFEPEHEWEKKGQVPNVVFVEGMVKKGVGYLLYYGAADSAIGVAESKLISTPAGK